MKQKREYPKITITKKGQKAIENGHPWVYEGEVLSAQDVENGTLADVVNEKGTYLGTGFYSEKSKIRVRLVSRNANDRFDRLFWKRRIQYAWQYRKQVMEERDWRCCRIIFGEADGFPGLTVDRYNQYLVTQVVSLGMDKIKEMIYELLVEVLFEDQQIIDGIMERSDVTVRRLEGLEKTKGWAWVREGHHPESSVTIEENGIRYRVDIGEGQKTGFFLDQKFNRQAVARLAKGKRVLDCCTHTGSFALNAAYGQAAFVSAADISSAALTLARKNAELNGLQDKIEFIEADIFELLPKLIEKKANYDLIILDPPAFTKSRKTRDAAYHGYKRINSWAMQLLPRGGYLATASCSHFMKMDQFEKMLKEAAKEAHVQLRQIEVRQQGADHPVLWGVEETFYLKFYLFQVV